MKVLKFGGTSVGSPERLRDVVHLVGRAAVEARVVVVASAASGVTDRLAAAFDALAAGRLGPRDVEALVAFLAARHLALARAVLVPASLSIYAVVLRAHLKGLVAVLQTRRPEAALRDLLLALGERLSVPIVAYALRDAGVAALPVDAALLVRTDDAHGAARVDHAATQRLAAAWHAGLRPDAVPVVTGFVGATATGVTTTLGRGGSDYSAALLAAALDADMLERWTDVDGLYEADPRVDPSARRLEVLALDEAAARNRVGALGMHPRALEPLLAAGVPLHVRATAHPDGPGTRLVPQAACRAWAC